MSIKITLSMEDGNPVVDMTSEFSQKDVELTPEEADAVGLVMAAAGSYAALLHCERRTDSYLSIVGPEYGDDFCRIKVGSRSCWISLDLWRCDVSDDPRLSAVKNKRQRHWKIPLSSVSEISSLGDLIQTSLETTLGRAATPPLLGENIGKSAAYMGYLPAGIDGEEIVTGINKNLIDFIAIDFETATSDMDSACCVGIAVVSDLKIVYTHHAYIQPPGNEYDARNIQIHGITAEHTAHEKSGPEVLLPIAKLLDSTVVVAHNAQFDMSVLRKSMGFFPEIDFAFVDTMDMVKTYDICKRDLVSCATHFGIDMENHHNALDDAVTCANIAIACVKNSQYDRMADFCMRTKSVKIRWFSELKAQDAVSFRKSRVYQPPISSLPLEELHVTADKNHPLYGKRIVFTGELSMDRATAAKMAAKAGAEVKSGVSKKTDYLVVGAQDCAVVGADGMSSKEEKAHALNATGTAHIHIVNEQEFLNLLRGELCENADPV